MAAKNAYIADCVEQHKDEILDRWRKAAKEDSAQAERLAQMDDRELLDHLPALTEAMIGVLRGEQDSPVEDDARRHGHQRRLDGYSVVDVLWELTTFRRVFLGVLDEASAAVADWIPIDGSKTILDLLDLCARASIDQYVKETEQERDAAASRAGILETQRQRFLSTRDTFLGGLDSLIQWIKYSCISSCLTIPLSTKSLFKELTAPVRNVLLIELFYFDSNSAMSIKSLQNGGMEALLKLTPSLARFNGSAVIGPRPARAKARTLIIQLRMGRLLARRHIRQDIDFACELFEFDFGGLENRRSLAPMADDNQQFDDLAWTKMPLKRFKGLAAGLNAFVHLVSEFQHHAFDFAEARGILPIVGSRLSADQ